MHVNRNTVPVYRDTVKMEIEERTPFGKRLFEAREEAGLTQDVAAKKVSMSQGTLAEAEVSGKRSGFTPQLANLYGVNPVWLATGKGVKQQTTHESTATIESQGAFVPDQSLTRPNTELEMDICHVILSMPVREQARWLTLMTAPPPASDGSVTGTKHPKGKSPKAA